jgi:para-aminobenzoate synthetase/4-amino-4-deoxychorismate lyase
VLARAFANVVNACVSSKKGPIGAIVAEPIQIILDDARKGRMRVYARPRERIVAHEPGDVLPALAAMESARKSGKHLAGYFSYELGYVLEPKLAPLLPAKRKVPLLWFGIFDDVQELAGEEIEGLFETNIHGRVYAGSLKHAWDENAYRARFDMVRAFIEAGDIYQANLSFRSHFNFVGDSMALYRDLRAQSRAPHGAFVSDGERYILSLSPELFFRISADGEIAAKPMKGTAPRGEDEQSDARRLWQLGESSKDRAENLMIVDLLRNDIGRLAQTGSVGVSDLFAVETYPTVHQMVSTVSARLRPSLSISDVVRALFPCGSVTGAPKIRAMEIIADQEVDPRGVYCGAIGYFAPDGSTEFNVAIRTLTIGEGSGELGIGGAVVYDSKVESEYAECLLKARYYEVSRKPLELIETLRFSTSCGFVRRDLHLARMQRSAEMFGVLFSVQDGLGALEAAVENAPASLRVRLSLNEAGVFHCATALAPADASSWSYKISPIRISSADALLRHKTNWREVFETFQSGCEDCDEVLFLNEHGHITEGTRTNVFAKVSGQLCTSPLSDGLLGGCLREEMIALGQCVERSLTVDDLEAAEEVYLGNSLRGLIVARRATAD